VILLGWAFAAESFEGQRFYAGDLHVHTGYSFDGQSSDYGLPCTDDGGCGAIVDLPQTARDNGLDFFAVTDHVNGAGAPTTQQWEHLHGLVRAWNRPDQEFVTVPGAELMWTAEGSPLGHKNVLFFGTDRQLEGLTVEALQHNGEATAVEDCDAVWERATELSADWGPLLFVPHHPAASTPMVTDWSCQHATWQPTAEAYSSHGSSFNSSDTYDPIFSSTVEEGTMHAAYDADLVRLGVHAGTDNHRTRPGSVCAPQEEKFGGGITIAVIDESLPFTRTSLFDALSGRSTMASSGPLLPVSVDYCAGGERVAGHGEDLALAEGSSFVVRVRVPEADRQHVSRVQLVMPNVVSDMTDSGDDWRLTAVSLPEWMYVRVLIDGETWYGDEGCDDGNDTWEERIWTSVSYVDVVEGEPSLGEGCGSDDGAVVDTGGGVDSWPETGHAPDLVDRIGERERDSAAPTYRSDGTYVPPVVEGDPVVRPEPDCACSGAGGFALSGLLPLLVLARRRRR